MGVKFNINNTSRYDSLQTNDQWRDEDAEPIPEPFGVKNDQGHLTLWIPPEIHRQLAIRSAEEGVPINPIYSVKDSPIVCPQAIAGLIAADITHLIDGHQHRMTLFDGLAKFRGNPLNQFSLEGT